MYLSAEEGEVPMDFGGEAIEKDETPKKTSGETLEDGETPVKTDGDSLEGEEDPKPEVEATEVVAAASTAGD